MGGTCCKMLLAEMILCVLWHKGIPGERLLFGDSFFDQMTVDMVYQRMVASLICQPMMKNSLIMPVTYQRVP